MAADRPALERVYRSGAVNQGDNLDQVAIIDLRGPDPGAFHDVYRTYAMRARLEREHGTTREPDPVARAGAAARRSATTSTSRSWPMDTLAGRGREATRATCPLAQKILEDKPAT